ncbi:MAG: hypothetical protein GY953_42120 [bacterium]|nr:hypothetical protein [bacterium]
MIINSVEPTELCVMLYTPRPLADSEERRRLVRSLGVLSNIDIMLARVSPGILYLEGSTDLEILREWARILEHPVSNLLTTSLFWKQTVDEARPGSAGIKARDHYEALKLVRQDLPGLELIDGDPTETNNPRRSPAAASNDCGGNGTRSRVIFSIPTHLLDTWKSRWDNWLLSPVSRISGHTLNKRIQQPISTIRSENTRTSQRARRVLNFFRQLWPRRGSPESPIPGTMRLPQS